MADNIDRAMRNPARRAIRALQEQLGIGASKDFCCPFFEVCDRSVSGAIGTGRKGDWVYVGDQYGGACVGGKRAGVLFVSMDRPGEEPEWTFEHVQAGYRRAARIRGNPHMGGVDVEMEHLLDGGASPDDRCQQFALVNSVLCGPSAARTAKGKPSAKSLSSFEMRTQCQKHTRRIIQTLEPDIVIAQGGWPSTSVKDLLVDPQQVGDRWKNQMTGRQRREVELWRGSIEGGKPLLALLTSHPANYPRFAWKTGRLPDELSLGIQRTREEHAKMAG